MATKGCHHQILERFDDGGYLCAECHDFGFLPDGTPAWTIQGLPPTSPCPHPWRALNHRRTFCEDGWGRDNPCVEFVCTACGQELGTIV